MMIITIMWLDGIPCIDLPPGVILLPGVKSINPPPPPHQKNFTKLQKIKENDCFKDLLGELKDKFKEQKE